MSGLHLPDSSILLFVFLLRPLSALRSFTPTCCQEVYLHIFSLLRYGDWSIQGKALLNPVFPLDEWAGHNVQGDQCE